MLSVDILLGCIILLLIGIPSTLLFLELILGQVALKPSLTNMKREGAVILIPAHNEEPVIGKTLEKLKKEVSKSDRILVVADNCTDSTVNICTQYEVEVIQRVDKKLIGKGYALDFGIQHLQNSKIKTVVIVDADCEFKPGSLDILVGRSQYYNKIVQSMYLMKAPVNADSKTRVAEFAWLITNVIRSVGRTRLGISSHMQGSGMAFPHTVFDKVSLASANIVEDFELGLKLLNLGEKVIFDDDAVIVSYFPSSDEGLNIQRKRWEHGRLSAIYSLFKMMFKAILKKRSDVFWLALDASIPPTILWLTLVFATGVLSIFLLFFSISLPAILLFFCFILLVIAICISWVIHARNIIQIKDLFGAFQYILSKFSIYRTFFTSRQKDWVRTIREDKHE